ncbi:alpha/beta hydrolase, partial [Mycobacterium tuberculosis]
MRLFVLSLLLLTGSVAPSLAAEPALSAPSSPLVIGETFT